MKISVAVRAKLWGFQVAQQLLRHETLHTLFTSHYGKMFGRDNSIGFRLPATQVRTNMVSAIHTYLLQGKWELEGERRFGQWVARQLSNEDAVVTWGLQAQPIIQAARQKGIRVILERGSSHAAFQRDILMEESERFGSDTGWLRKSFSEARMERELWEYEQADLIVVPSGFVKRTFIEKGVPVDKVFVNHFGVDLSTFTPGNRTDGPFRVIYTGQQTLRKGVQYLLQAFAELELPDAELWLVGKGSEEIAPFIQRYGRQVVCHPPVPQHLLPAYYQACDVFAICSIEEGLALVQPQAMACGLPLICTTNTGGEDLITDGQEGFVLSIRDVETLKEKISYLYHNRDICKRMGLKARQKLQAGFSWDDYGDRMIARYKAL